MTRPMTTVSRDRYRGSRSRERSTSKSNKKGKEKERDFGPPGAGALLVYGSEGRESSRSPRRKRISKEREKRGSKVFTLNWEDVVRYPYEPCRSKSPDRLLEGGIDCYTFIPAHQGGILGRGKFSTVYKVTDTEGGDYALKHTPLHPHHPLIAARLLREPTLLASLPTHPCLIGVHGSIRTTGHFYLIEQYATNHVPLSAHPTPLRPSRAAYLLDQLVSVVRDCLHSGGRVVHRDLKAENILVDIGSGDLLLLDLGLGTHFSASEPKLTTCCGSPAFHSPEVVNALNHPPGEVSYYGPELDIWCIALTLLSLLLDIRFPIGPSHKSLHIMRDRVLDRLQELDEVYPPSSPWNKFCRTEDLTPAEREVEILEWRKVRRALRDFLDINGIRRMASCASYSLGGRIEQRVELHAMESGLSTGFKETSFIPSDIKHTLPLYLDSEADEYGSITLSNPGHLSERKVISYLKYILRSRGILYHCASKPHFLDTTPIDHGPVTLQLVLPFPSPVVGDIQNIPNRGETKRESWVSSIFNSAPKRASSVPPQQVRQQSPSAEEKKGGEWYLKCWARIEVEKPFRAGGSRNSSRRGSSEALTSPVMTSPTSPLLTLNTSPLSPLTTLEEVTSDTGTPRARSVEPKARALPPIGARTSSTSRLPRRPHPLSRQVSLESKVSTRVASNPTPSKVTITLSDPRGYGVLRKVFDVKHNKYGDSPASVTSTTLVAPSERSEATAVEAQDTEEVREEEEEEERGRPRSKEEAKVIVMAHVTRPVRVAAPASRHPRQVSRGRKMGFLEGWFGIGGIDDKDEPLRSASSPPSTMPTIRATR